MKTVLSEVVKYVVVETFDEFGASNDWVSEVVVGSADGFDVITDEVRVFGIEINDEDGWTAPIVPGKLFVEEPTGVEETITWVEVSTDETDETTDFVEAALDFE